MVENNASKGRVKLNSYGIRGIFVWYFMVVLYFLALVIFSGMLDWFNAWIYLLSSTIYISIYVLILFKKNPEILNERGRVLRKETKPFDKVFVILWLPGNFVCAIIMAWDIRFQWSYMPSWIFLVGIVLTIPGFVLAIKAILTNPYFELTVRIQEDRNHRVITSGPYKFIRHPGYASEIIILLSTPFILGSAWGFIPVGGMIVVFFVRTALEDRTLREELPGYKDYANNTRYKIIPYIW